MNINKKENKSYDKVSEAKELIKKIKNAHMENQFGEWMQEIEEGTGTISIEMVDEFMEYLIKKQKHASEYDFKKSLSFEFENAGRFLAINTDTPEEIEMRVERNQERIQRNYPIPENIDPEHRA